MELECVGDNFQWNSSIRDSISCSAQIKKRESRENYLRLRESYTFIGLIQVWVRGFCHLGRGFAAWVRGFAA